MKTNNQTITESEELLKKKFISWKLVPVLFIAHSILQYLLLSYIAVHLPKY